MAKGEKEVRILENNKNIVLKPKKTQKNIFFSECFFIFEKKMQICSLNFYEIDIEY